MNLNYNYLNNIKYKNYTFILVICILLLILLVLSFVIETYSSYTTYGKYNEGALEVLVPIENSDIINYESKIKVNSKVYDYKINSISDILENNYVNYQNYIINIPLDLQQNEVTKITFYFNKEKMIKKIINFIF